jgi:hypothetical protein
MGKNYFLNLKSFLGFAIIFFPIYSIAQNQDDLLDNHFSNKNVKSIDYEIYNLSGFAKKPLKKVTPVLEQNVDPKFSQHPEYGLSFHDKQPEAIELVDKKTLHQSTYLKPNGTTAIFRSSSQPINFEDENGWLRTINFKMEAIPTADGTYHAPNQPFPKSVNAKTGRTTLASPYGDMVINQKTAIIIPGATSRYKEIAKIGQYTAGEDGIFAQDIWPGIDMQIIMTTSGGVKTNYIIKEKSTISKVNDEIIFEDIITLPNGLRLVADEKRGDYIGNSNDFLGILQVLDEKDQEISTYMPALIYDKNYAANLMNAGTMSIAAGGNNTVELKKTDSDAFIYGAYRITKITGNVYKVAVVVPGLWLQNDERVYPVVVDPIFTGTPLALAGLRAVRINGTTPVNDPFNHTAYGGRGCHATTTVLPAGYMLIQSAHPVLVTAGYFNNGCARSNTFMTYYGPCGKDPRLDGYFWFCSSNFAGGCIGTDTRMDGILSRCALTRGGEDCAAAGISFPRCTDQTITFRVCYQTRCTGGTANQLYPGTAAEATAQGTGTQYVYGYHTTEPQVFKVDVEGEKIRTVIRATVASGANVCPNTVVGLNNSTIFGVPLGMPTGYTNCTDSMGGTYTYTWSASGAGSTGGTFSSTTAKNPTYTTGTASGAVTITLTACGACTGLSAAINCHTVTYTFNNGQAIAPIVPNGFACDGNAYTGEVSNPQGGYTYTWFDVTGGGSISLGTGVTRGLGTYSGTTRTYTVRATAPCNSDITTFTVTWGPMPVPNAASINTCPNLTHTLFADCGNDCRWFDAASGGTLLSSTGTYTTPVLTTSTTYYVERRTSSTCASLRIPVSVNITGLTVTNTPSTPTEVCNSSLGFTTTFTGGTDFLDVTQSAGTINVTVPDNQACTDPGDATGCPSTRYGSTTVTTPANVANPMTSESIRRVCVSVTNACPPEIKMWLSSPSGTVFTLQSPRAKNKQPDAYNNTMTCYDVLATTVTPTANANVFCNDPNGYQPDGGALGSAFVGENPYAGTGTWTLFVNDGLGQTGNPQGCTNAARITHFSMVFRTAAPITYVWSGAPLTNLSSSTIANPNFTSPPDLYNYTYTVLVTDAAGCTGSNTVNVFCAVLPVELLTFDVSKVPEGNLLSWQTASEVNNEGFFIERSSDGTNFEDIGFQEGAGNSNIINSYTFIDTSPNEGINYYRLRQVDFDGKEEYSKLVAINNRSVSTKELISVYPNPSRDKIEVMFSAEDYGGSIQIFDAAGKMVYDRNEKFEQGVNIKSINTSNFAPGIYFIVVNSPAETRRTRFIVDK